MAKRFGDNLPVGTMVANVTGCLIIGLAAAFTVENGKTQISASAQQFLMIGLLGGATATLGFLFAAYTGFRALNGSTVVPGWASLIIINLTFGGLVLIALGINGEYLIRILESSSDRPPYHVRREKK